MVKHETTRRHAHPSARGPRGSVMIATLMAVVVLLVLAVTILTVSHSEDFNVRREQTAVLAFYAAEGGIHEALARMNVDPTGAGNDETEILWGEDTGIPGLGTGNPDSVRDPRMVLGNLPEPNPVNLNFWNYDPNWVYSGNNAAGDGNYPGATSAQQANLDLAGRMFPYAGASARTLPSGSNYWVRVVPLVRNFAGTWKFANENGAEAAPSTYYYKVSSTGMNGGQSATARIVVRKFYFGSNVGATLIAGGGVTIGGNASVTAGDGDDANPTGVAVQSAGTASATGSGTITGGDTPILNDTPFPGFETVFGMTREDLCGKATITATYTANNTTNPGAVPSGTAGKVMCITAMNGGVKKDITFTGSGSDGYMIGTPTQPVVLVVNGNLNLNSVTIYGIIYVTGYLRNQGGSQIKGSLIVEGTAETDILGTAVDITGSGKDGGTKIGYSMSVLRNLNSNLFPFGIVKGSWRMSRG